MNIKNFAVGVIAVLALVLSAFGLMQSPEPQATPTPAVSSEPLGGPIETVVKTFSKGIVLGNTGMNTVQGFIKGTENQASVKNDTGKTIYARIPAVAMINNAAGTGMASSTFNVYMASSSAATLSCTTCGVVGSDYVMPFKAFVGGTIATGTRVHEIQGIFSATTSLIVAIPADAYYNILLTSTFHCGTPNKSAMNTHKCDTATSTNRGFDLRYEIPYSYSPN